MHIEEKDFKVLKSVFISYLLVPYPPVLGRKLFHSRCNRYLLFRDNILFITRRQLNKQFQQLWIYYFNVKSNPGRPILSIVIVLTLRFFIQNLIFFIILYHLERI